MRLNIHMPWFVRRFENQGRSAPTGQFVMSMLEAFMQRPELELSVSRTGYRAHELGEDVYCINYHRYYARLRNLNVKQAYLPHYFYADPRGYSGWSEISIRTFDPEKYKQGTANGYFKRRIQRPYLDRHYSKFDQKITEAETPDAYILVPLQVPDDEVLKLAYFSQDEMLEASLKLAAQMPVVIKLHPAGRNQNPEYVARIRALHDPAKGVFVVDDHIYRLIPKAHAVICTNSGVGLESLMFCKPVINCGRCDYHHLTQTARQATDIDRLVSDAVPPDGNLMRKYMLWFFRDQLIDIRDDPAQWSQEVLNRVKATATQDPHLNDLYEKALSEFSEEIQMG